MKPNTSGRHVASFGIRAGVTALLTFLASSTTPVHAATMSAGASAPAIDGEDIANYGGVSGTDKWWTGTDGASTAKGQTFTTGGGAVRLKAISYQIAENQKAEPTKTYAIRVGEVAGTTFTVVHAETATQNFTWNAGEFMTWTFDTPVLLKPHTTYGIDVGLLSSTTAWQTGIPYLNLTDDDFPGGSRYTSGVSGTGTSSVALSIASDRIFHLDVERPLGPVFELVSTSPADDAADVLASREIVLTFSQDVSAGSGSIRLRDLTDPMAPVETAIAANDPRLTYDRNVVRIDPAGLLDWSRDYAIRLDAGAILGDGGAPIAGIGDDTTWNFSTLPGDPLLDAIAALKNHITGAAILTGPQIATHKTTLDDLRQRFAESGTTIGAVFDLITTYDTVNGPLFVTGSTATNFNRNNTNPADKRFVGPENIHWVVYTVMQHAMDVIYTADALAAHEASLTGYKFGSHADFPGPCAPPADPANTHTVAINGSFPVTFGRNTQAWTSPARKPTGTYLAPGTIATITVPPALVNAGYKVRVGAHSWDLSGRAPVERLERATRLYPLDATTIKLASPYGGGIYVEVPIGADAGVVNVTVTGAVRAPYFSAKSFHQTTSSEWLVERTHPAPWADFQSEKFMTQVPRKWIYNMTGAQAAQMMADWDAAMDAINSLMGFPTDRGKETMYCQPDVILRSSVHAPGYPAVNVTTNPNSEVSPLGYSGSYLVRGPGANPTASQIEFHEQGHAYGFPKFGGESESNVNLLQPAMLHRKFGYDFDTAHRASLGSGNTFRTIDNTAVAWMCVFNFSPREVPMDDGEKAYQHKGHAKFMDIARLFATPSNPYAGWEKLDAYWRSFMEDDANNVPYGTSDDDKLLRLSRHVGADIRPLFHFWGIHPQNPQALDAAIAAENLPRSLAIRDQLLHYKSLVPDDNAAFRAFATAWWGKQPSINGYWEEREHSRQWDQAALFGAGDQQRAGITINEEYIPACAQQIRDRVDELVALYFPSGITPAQMSFAIAPGAVDSATVGMTATTATAANGPVQYWFENGTNGTDSGWITTSTWQQGGLAPGDYSYRVKARDGLGEETAWSAPAVASLTAAGDVTPPAPSPMAFATPPYATDENTITMTAATATDVNGVEYYFENTLGGGGDSGWQASPVFTDGNLSPSTEYGYRVKARDGQGNETAWSDPATTNTADIPDVTPPQVVTLSPAGPVTDVAANLVVIFDEPVVAGSGNITIKNLTAGTQSQVGINDAARVTISGAVVTINPDAELLINRSYAVRIDPGAVADASNNPFIGIADDSTWAFNVILADPLADPGGPYSVGNGGSLSLDGSGSLPSEGQSITAYDWDLDNDGDFDEAISGATPASISYDDLQNVYGMVVGASTIKLRVTDDSSPTPKTSTVEGTVTILAPVSMFTPSTVRPVFDGEDIGYFNDPLPSTAGSPGDKWFAELSGAGQTKGQSFTITGDRMLKGVTYRLANSQATPTKVYVVRISALDTATGTLYPVHTEEITQNDDWGVGNTDSYGTWSFGTPITLPGLPAGTTYGIDIAMKSSTSAWQTGIPYPTYMNSNVYAGGYKYTCAQTGTLGSATTTVQADSGRDREFHLDLDAATIVDTTAPTLTLIADQVGGGPIYEDQVQVAYLLTFDERVDETTIDLADFENLGSGVSLDSVVSVTQTTPYPVASAIRVVFGVSGAGTLQLGVKTGSNIADVAGNPVTSPVADDTTITVNAGANPGSGDRWWDLATTGVTDGVSQGGTGNWDTTTTNWDRGFGFANPVAWTNGGGETAIFGGTTGTVTLDEDITLDGLTFQVVDAGGSGYFIGDAAEDHTLTFSGSKTITLNATGANSNQDATIRAGIAGSPTLNIHGRANNAQFFALEPTANVTMTLGTLNMFNTFGSNKQLRLGGPGSGNVVDKVTWTVTGNQLQVRKQDSTNGGADGSDWTINQDISLDDGRIYVDEGTLILGGTNNFCSHSIEIAAGGRIVMQGNWRIHDENEDFRVLSGGIVAPGVGVGTVTFNWNSSRNDPSVGLVDLRTGSTYEWEVGASATDVIALTEPVANGNAELVVASGTTLKVIDAGGTPSAGDQLPVFTYGAGVVTPDTATLNANMTIDISGTSYTGTPSLVNDGAGTIYLTGISGGGGGNPFDTWAGTGTLGPVTFDGDTNGDGVQDGMAFLLGVANPDDDANGSLPTVTEDGSGNLVMQFNCLPSSARGTAELRVAHSNTLASFTATVDQVPDADDAVPDNDVTFVVGAGPAGPPALNSVTATIGSAAASGGKLFGRLVASE